MFSLMLAREQAVEETLELSVIWDAMMLMPGHYNDVHTYTGPNFVITTFNKSHGTAYINLDKVYLQFPSQSLI